MLVTFFLALFTHSSFFYTGDMETNQKNPLIDTIYEYLKQRILHGELPVGEKLSENSLASRFSCSRTPVREALKRLEQDGFIIIVAHSGTYVRDSSIVDFQQLAEVRTYLEALAIRLACENHADATELEKILDQMDSLWQGLASFDIQEFSRLHYLFHLKLVALSGNELLVQTYGRLNLNEAALLFSQGLNTRGLLKTQSEHRKLVDAIKAADAKKGEQFMLSHLWKKRDRFRKQALST